MPAFTIISSVPTFITPDEHKERTSETPSSFSDIPPVLRHREDNVTVVFDPAVEGFSFTAEGESLKGSLYVLENSLVFMAEEAKGLKIEYRAITLHAVSRSESGDSHIYCQLEEPVDEKAISNKEDEDSEMLELKLIPQNTSSLDAIFEALSACAALHPDPAGDSDDDMGLGDDDAFADAEFDPSELITGEGEGPELTEAGRATLDRLEAMLEQQDAEISTSLNGANGLSERETRSRSESNKN